MEPDLGVKQRVELPGEVSVSCLSRVVCCGWFWGLFPFLVLVFVPFLIAFVPFLSFILVVWGVRRMWRSTDRDGEVSSNLLLGLGIQSGYAIPGVSLVDTLSSFNLREVEA